MSSTGNGKPDREPPGLGVAAAWLGIGVFIVGGGLALNDVFILIAGVLVVIYAILVGWPLITSRPPRS